MAEGVISGLEAAHGEMVNWLVDQTHQMRDAIGKRPLFAEKIPERIQARQGALVYHDPQAWTSLLQAHGWQGPGSPVPKNVIEYGQRLERLKGRYPDEFATGLQAKEGERLTQGEPHMAPSLPGGESALPAPSAQGGMNGTQ